MAGGSDPEDVKPDLGRRAGDTATAVLADGTKVMGTIGRRVRIPHR
jgi:hypothetical protein